MHVVLHENIAAAPSQADGITVRLDDNDEYSISKASQPASGMCKRKITDLKSWMEAWSVYALIVTHHSPHRAIELLHYQSSICEAVRWHHFPLVAEYDRKFRIRASNDKSIPWDQKDHELWLEFLTPASDSQASPAAMGRVCTPCNHCGSTTHWPRNCPQATFHGYRSPAAAFPFHYWWPPPLSRLPVKTLR